MSFLSGIEWAQNGRLGNFCEFARKRRVWVAFWSAVPISSATKGDGRAEECSEVRNMQPEQAGGPRRRWGKHQRTCLFSRSRSDLFQVTASQRQPSCKSLEPFGVRGFGPGSRFCSVPDASGFFMPNQL